VIAHRANCDVVPVWLDGLGSPIFSFKTGNLFAIFLNDAASGNDRIWKTDAGAVRLTQARREKNCWSLTSSAFNIDPSSTSIWAERPSEAERWQFDDAIIDGDCGRREQRGDLLATSIALSRWIKKKCPDERVAIALPPGVGAVVTNLAVTLAGKIPVNFDSAGGSVAFHSAIKRSQITHSISSVPVIKRLEGFASPKDPCSWKR